MEQTTHLYSQTHVCTHTYTHTLYCSQGFLLQMPGKKSSSILGKTWRAIPPLIPPADFLFQFLNFLKQIPARTGLQKRLFQGCCIECVFKSKATFSLNSSASPLTLHLIPWMLGKPNSSALGLLYLSYQVNKTKPPFEEDVLSQFILPFPTVTGSTFELLIKIRTNRDHTIYAQAACMCAATNTLPYLSAVPSSIS